MKTILVIDDDQSIRSSLQKLLRQEGYNVVAAGDSEEALDLFHQGGLDLIILDLQLPTKSGWDVFGAVLQENPLVPTIMITGRPNQRRLAASAGIAALLEKPLDVDFLLGTVEKVLSEPYEQRLDRLMGKSPLRHSPGLRSQKSTENTCDVL